MKTSEILRRAEARCKPYETKPLKTEVQSYVPPIETFEHLVESLNSHFVTYLADSASEFERVQITGPAREALGWAVLEVGKSVQYTPHAGKEVRRIGEKLRKAGIRMIDGGRVGAPAPPATATCPMEDRILDLERRLLN